jgi:hypothetical protein
MTNPMKEFSIATISCFDVSLQALSRCIESVLEEYDMKVLVQKVQFDYDEFGPEPLRGPGQKKAGLWAPAGAIASSSCMMSNLVDGWLTLATAVSLRLGCRCWRFTVSRDDKPFPRNAFSFMQAGHDLRVVSAQRDDPSWVFYAKGNVLDAEVELHYTRRRIKDRVTREYVISIAERSGFPLGSDDFWITNNTSLFLTEER